MHNPAVSPCTNLMRRSGPYNNNYYGYVRTEQKRRTQQRVDQALQHANPRQIEFARNKLQGVERTMGVNTRGMTAGRPPGNYHNRFYGQRQMMGLR